MRIQSINPVNGKIIETYKEETERNIAIKIEKSQKAWLEWRETSFKQRAILLKNAATVLRSNKNNLALVMANEMGKPLAAGVMEIEKCATVCDYYATNGEKYLHDQSVATEAEKSFISFQPIGVVLAVMPWNFPFWQVFRFLAPALMAGNGAILKHASNVPGCAIAIENIIKQAGFPTGIFQSLIVGSKAVKKIIGNPIIKAVTLTGSTQAGIQVAQQAGSLIKKTVLELGGSDPYVILDDADIEQASESCAQSRLINNGQSCIAAKRFIVTPGIEKEFVKRFLEKMSQQKFGDPLVEGTALGPMAKKSLRDELHEQVIQNVNAGAEIILGGTIPNLPGDHAYYPPTILTGVKKGMPAYTEEIFGPVASIISVKNEAEAIEVANDSSFGLGAAVFTRDNEKGEKIARELLQAGSCFVNTAVKSDPRLPFGGINQSGYGRELGMFGIHEFVNIKTVYVK